jgi:broad specificity phosphatase PhoE
VFNSRSTTLKMPKQYVWLIRYGKTKYPLVEFDGPFDSDIDPSEGIIHAKAIAEQVASSPADTLPSKIYSSPFLRTTHTASILATALSKQVNVEEGLYEFLIPSLLVDRSGTRTYPRTVEELKKIFHNIDASYDKALEITPEMFPEDESKLIERCRNTLNGILAHERGNNVAIVAHAPCVQALAFVMEGVRIDDSKLDRWPLGGITRFSRDEKGEWEMDFYGVTEHMPGEYKKGAGLWSLPCFDK